MYKSLRSVGGARGGISRVAQPVGYRPIFSVTDTKRLCGLHFLFEAVSKMLNILPRLFGPLNTNPVSFCHQNAAVGMYCQTPCEWQKSSWAKNLVLRQLYHRSKVSCRQPPSHWWEPR